jgi:hypothetical protein
MHLYRDGARQRTKILYVFRTPGGVRVGRDPLEIDVRRQIEAQYPDIQFNWNAVRDTQQIIETAVERHRRTRPSTDARGALSEAEGRRDDETPAAEQRRENRSRRAS